MKYIFVSFLFFFIVGFHPGSSNIKSLNVLFIIGNSYTYVNDLPHLLAAIAESAGDHIDVDSYTQGGYTLRQHVSDSNALNKIKKGNWDHVVLQEQSRLPSFPINEVEKEVFPYVHSIDSTIHKYSPKSKTIFYMTWGRKNGDSARCATWAPICSYKGMDSLLALRYILMAKNNHADLSPVGAVWNYIRTNYPSIELYQPDASHPSTAGSYAAACCFYTTLFNKNPGVIKYNYSINEADALKIRNAVKSVVFDDLKKWKIN